MKRIVVVGGGTFSHVRNHLSLAAPAFGGTARKLSKLLAKEVQAKGSSGEYVVERILTRMADPKHSRLETNDDVALLVDQLIADPTVGCIVFNVALADFQGQIGDVASGKMAQRLNTSEGDKYLQLSPADKLIGRIRQTRKDIFVVGFNTTTNASPDEQYNAALRLLKTNSLNLVVANDLTTEMNMIVAPEEARYAATTDRAETLQFLTRMTVSRMQNRFTRSTVVEGQAVAWNSDAVPESLRTVVNHCIKAGAYKPVLGKTAGHFAVKVGDAEILTSIRKSNFNQLAEVGLVRVESEGEDTVIAHGFKPSVGGQSQRIIFREHEDLDCIVHFHCPVKTNAPARDAIPVTPQWPNECGSHDCGRNTSRNLRQVDLGDGHRLSVVYLDEHGPNVVFNRTTPPEKVCAFIDANFDLAAKTGGLVTI